MLTVFTAGIAVCGALVASTLSGLTAASGYTSGCSAYHYTSSCNFKILLYNPAHFS
jgi:hypothetical protein